MKRPTPMAGNQQTTPVPIVVKSTFRTINRKPVAAQDPISHVAIASNSISALVNSYYKP